MRRKILPTMIFPMLTSRLPRPMINEAVPSNGRSCLPALPDATAYEVDARMLCEREEIQRYHAVSWLKVMRRRRLALQWRRGFN